MEDRRARYLLVLAALSLSACGSLAPGLDYVSGHRERVPANIPEFKIEQLDVFNAPNHPMKVWVESTGRKISMAMNGQVDQWVAILPRIEPLYREAALTALSRGGKNTCEITGSLPYPDQFAIEFSYTCH